MTPQRSHGSEPSQPSSPGTESTDPAGRIVWASHRMPVLRAIAKDLADERPFAGVRIGICLHLEPKTAVLLGALRDLGAETVATGNFGTTQDDVVERLADEGFDVFGRRDDDVDVHLANKRRVLASDPHLLLDNGAELFALRDASTPGALFGGTEETTTGGERLRSELRIELPVIVINDSPLKRIFENEVGVGQSVLEAVMRITNSTPAGREVVVVGFGWCGRGIAHAFRSMAARVSIVETDPVRALDAAVHGYAVRSLADAAAIGHLFITATGREGSLPASAIDTMRSGAVLANAGHFGVEIDRRALERDATVTTVAPSIERFERTDGRALFLLAGGEMVNLAGGSGNPIEPMDMGLSLQLLSLLWVIEHRGSLSVGPLAVPDEINARVARRMLEHLSPESDRSIREPE